MPATADVNGTSLLSSKTFGRVVRNAVPMTAPSHALPTRNPSVCASPPNTSRANIGINTVYGDAVRLINATSARNNRIGRVFHAYRAATANSLRSELEVFARDFVARFIIETEAMIATKLAKLMRKH